MEKGGFACSRTMNFFPLKMYLDIRASMVIGVSYGHRE